MFLLISMLLLPLPFLFWVCCFCSFPAVAAFPAFPACAAFLLPLVCLMFLLRLLPFLLFLRLLFCHAVVAFADVDAFVALPAFASARRPLRRSGA
jgi:hypothetical protein